MQGISHRLRPAFVAEFLEHLSHGRLSLLDQSTCVGYAVRQNMILPTNLFLKTETYDPHPTFLRFQICIHHLIKHSDGFTYQNYFMA